MPLATDVLAGERADDGLSLPIMERIRTGLKTPGLLFVGDCKISHFTNSRSLPSP
jgi:transposase